MLFLRSSDGDLQQHNLNRNVNCERNGVSAGMNGRRGKQRTGSATHRNENAPAEKSPNQRHGAKGELAVSIVTQPHQQAKPLADVAAPITWVKLADTEPMLLSLVPLAASAHSWRDWEQVKRDFQFLVGFDARRRELRTAAAYDVVYRHLLDVFEGTSK
jgi:hypothetical protein